MNCRRTAGWLSWCLVLLTEPLAQAAERVEFTLPNGLRVRLVAAPGEKNVGLVLGIRAGFLDEPAGVPHLAHVAEHLAYSDMQVGPTAAERMKQWQMLNHANGETLSDFMYFDILRPSEDLDLALKIQAARLTQVDFQRETLAREIPRTLAEIDMVEKMPGGPAKFALTVFTQAALHRRAENPIRKMTRQITLEQVKTFHSRTFRPDRAILCVTGDFDVPATRRVIEATFGTIPKPIPAVAPRPKLQPGTLKATWDISSRHLFLAWPAPEVHDSEHGALTLASFLLTRHLFQDQALKQLALNPQVSNDQEGMFLIQVTMKPGADPEQAKVRLLESIKRMASSQLSNDQLLNQAQMQLKMLLTPLNLEQITLPPRVTRGQARLQGELNRMRLEIVWGEVRPYQERSQKLTARQVSQAVEKYLKPDLATIVMVEPGQ